MKKLPVGVVTYLLLFSIFSSFSGFFVQTANASALTPASDTITTSRPSAASPIQDTGNGTTAGSTVATIANNGSRFVASDSAKLELETTSTPTANADYYKYSGMNVSSQSADLTQVFFTSGVPGVLQKGDGILTMPITASHSVTFTTQNTIPSGGYVEIDFPSTSGLDINNQASPSATTFQFNGLTAPQINITDSTGNWTPAAGCTVAEPVIRCKTNSSIPAGAVLSFGIPNLINPVKSAVAGTGDQYKVKITTEKSDFSPVDGPTNVVVNTIEAVTVSATIDSTFSMTIAANNSGSACGDSPPSNVANAFSVNLGYVTSTASNSASQLITVSTNAANGYAITATSSGHLANPTNGNYFPDANTGNNGNGLSSNTGPAPQPIVPGVASFGIHPCQFANGAGAPTIPSMWGNNGGWGTNGGYTGGTNNLFANPWNSGTNTYAMTLSTYPSQPTGNATKTYVEYAVTAGSNTPAGSYNTQYTYVGTPVF